MANKSNQNLWTIQYSYRDATFPRHWLDSRSGEATRQETRARLIVLRKQWKTHVFRAVKRIKIEYVREIVMN